MFDYDPKSSVLSGPGGKLSIPPGDQASLKMAMLLQGECTETGPTQAAKTFHYSKSRYYQIRDTFIRKGVDALVNKKTGPKGNYRRTPEVTKLVIRARFLDPKSSPEVIASKLQQDGYQIAIRSVERIINEFGLQKKLHIPFPRPDSPRIETQRTKTTRRMELCDERSIEGHVRQLLCDKISGNLVGIWLLIAEHLRLGTWDLLRRWTGKDSGSVEPRVALQLVHEAALGITGKRQSQTFSQQGFEVANGLPFVASSSAVHALLDSHTVAEAQTIQLMLGKLRHALGHYPGRVLAVDPHRILSHSKRQVVRRKKDPQALATKQVQTFFILDADSHQPIFFTLGSSSKTVSQATPELLNMTAMILNLKAYCPLVLADTEHYTFDLLEQVRGQLPFDLLVPMPQRKGLIKELNALPPKVFKRHWIGYATAKRPYSPKDTGTYWQTIQRCGECEQDYTLSAFICTSPHSAVDEPVQHYPKRWHCEEFFNGNQALGWHRAGTLNLNIRYGHMSMALIAQASIHMLRQRLGQPINKWDAKHLARDFFHGLEGDVRVNKDTIIVTYYNAPNVKLLRKYYTGLPNKLEQEGVDPRVPWLYNYKLDFRFK